MKSPEGADRRTERIVARAEALDRSRSTESREVSALIATFVERALAAGIPPTRFRARSYRGNARYRTNIEGWYLRRDQSLGIGTDGSFYVLSAPTSASARFTGVTLTPADPPMEIGRGARDGESMPFADALDKRLAAGSDYPS